MTETATLTIEQEISTLYAQLSEHEKELRAILQTIDELTQAPYIRFQVLQEVQNAYEKMKEQHEICRGQATEYIGSDSQVMFENAFTESTQKLKKQEKLLQDTLKEHEQKDIAENEKKRALQHKEQKIMHSATAIRHKLQELESQQDEKKRETAEKAYREYEELYQDMVKSLNDKQEAQDEIVKALADYPDLQERFLQEHSLPEPTTAVQKIARAAIEYLEALIEHGEELQGVTVFDGTPIVEVLALTDQEVLAHDHDGGIALLQEKRAMLLRYV